MKKRLAKYKQDNLIRHNGLMVIYTLAHPVTNQIFYIGATEAPNRRHRDHRKRLGFNPIFEEIEVIKREGEFGFVNVSKVESYWIQQFKAWGFVLENRYSYIRNIPVQDMQIIEESKLVA